MDHWGWRCADRNDERQEATDRAPIFPGQIYRAVKEELGQWMRIATERKIVAE